MTTTAKTTQHVTRLALERRILRLAREHGHLAYKDGEGGMLVILGEKTAFLRVLGDDDTNLPKSQQFAIARQVQRLLDGGADARVIWPRDWEAVAAMIVSGDWRN